MTDLDLERRGGLPDKIAFLRASYAKAEWQDHANFGELAGFWLHMHNSLREQGDALDRLTEEFRQGRTDFRSFQAKFVPGLNHFLQHLNGHHQVEDQAYFPKFRLLDAQMERGFDLLDRDHQRIHQALLDSAGAANEFVSALAGGGDTLLRAGDAYADQATLLLRLLTRHLADEEDLVIPAMLHHGERAVS